ncbi:glycosyltransferase family 9 protein [Leptolyngbya ohadii]|uniref:glycosyltransferase family 9 protein n=1 Tax=Leptolyngbya ohadii TaxID=1962290 RepID=UPI000B59B132|nr:glycosyltransferase family 9 protein [Leptolyngbya ohadii]
MRVVALVPGGVGDQILFFPTLDDLKRNYPDAEIDVVVEPRSKSVYRLSKSVSDVIPFDFKDRNSPADWANLLGIMRDRDYEAVLTLNRGWGTGLLLWLSGIETRVGFDNSGGSGFLTNKVPFKNDQYAARKYHDLLQGFGISSPCPPPSITVPRSELDWAEMEQKRLGVSSYVMIYPGSSPSGSYPVESWQRIVQDFLQKQPDLTLVVAQDENNSELVAQLTQACPTLKVTKPGDIGRLAAMIAGATLMICPESDAMQLAIALQVFTLAMFGSNDPAKLLPQSDKFLGIQSPTGKLADITPDQVLTKVWGG